MLRFIGLKLSSVLFFSSLDFQSVTLDITWQYLFKPQKRLKYQKFIPRNFTLNFHLYKSARPFQSDSLWPNWNVYNQIVNHRINREITYALCSFVAFQNLKTLRLVSYAFHRINALWETRSKRLHLPLTRYSKFRPCHLGLWLGLGFRVKVRVGDPMNIFSDYSVAKYALRSLQVYRPECC